MLSTLTSFKVTRPTFIIVHPPLTLRSSRSRLMPPHLHFIVYVFISIYMVYVLRVSARKELTAPAAC